ncbi:hypothetical protein CBR_g40996 [Chara braunii]|uniref:Uncharacterized protein n=1 Tax=Chara braunii TaxID=69332 RepID=A0A388LUU0_CHABU|nr:hypothetical protein CBR_g40996 [Chara braunii]|eukprot:GBG86094.1 hypothetical protein CBR_g40996 [Chara braunii]
MINWYLPLDIIGDYNLLENRDGGLGYGSTDVHWKTFPRLEGISWELEEEGEEGSGIVGLPSLLGLRIVIVWQFAE